MSPSAYPGDFDDLSNPSDADGDFLDSPGVLHDDQHTNANDAIEAIEHELGTTPSGSQATVRERFEYNEAGVASYVAVVTEEFSDVRDEFAAADSDLQDAIDAVQADVDHNESDSDAADLALGNRIEAVEDELGSNPSGLLDTVAERLDLMDLLIGNVGSGDDTFEELLLALSLQLGNAFNIRPTLTDPLDPVTTTAEINEAIITISAAGGGEIYFKSGDYYIGVDTVNDDFNEPWWHGGIVLHPGVSIYAEPGTRFVWADAAVGDSGVIMCNTDGFPETLNDCVIDEDVAFGSSVFHVDDPGTLAAGDRVLLRLGQNPYDPAEVLWWAHATVLDVTGNDVTLDRKSPYDLTVGEYGSGGWETAFDDYPGQSSVAPRRFPEFGNAMIRKLDPDRFCDSVRITGDIEFATLDPVRTPGAAFAFYNMRNVTLDGLQITDCHGSSIGFVENVTIDMFRVNHQDGTSQVYFGRGISMASVHHLRGHNWHLEGCTQNFLMLEAGCRDVMIDSLNLVHTNPDHNPDSAFITTGHECHLRIHGLVVDCHFDDVNGPAEGWVLYGRTPYGNLNPGTESLEVNDLEVIAPAPPLVFPVNIIKSGRTRLLTELNGSFAEVTLGPPEVWATDFPLRPSSTFEILLPDGVLASLGIFLASKTGITSVTYDNASLGSPAAIPLAMLIQGQFSPIGDDRLWETGPSATGTPAIDTLGNWGFQNALTGQKVTIVTSGAAPGGGLGFGSIKMKYLPIISVDGEPYVTQLHSSIQAHYRLNVGDIYHLPTGRAGFFGADPVEQPTDVPMTTEGVYDALVELGLIAAPGS